MTVSARCSCYTELKILVDCVGLYEGELIQPSEGILLIARRQSFTDFLVIRILLGAFEGGVIPGIAFVLSRFYRRHELVLRIGIFLALGPSLSGACTSPFPPELLQKLTLTF